MTDQNYTLGRGEIFFAKYLEGTETPGPLMYIGNTPEFNLTIEQETLDHFSSDRGINEKDDSVPLSVNRTGTLITDNIVPENVALFFFGSTSVLSQTATTVTAEEHEDNVKQGAYIQLGVTPSNPVGARGLDSTTPIEVTDGATTTYVVNTDYTIDYELGLLYIVPGGAIDDGDAIEVDYSLAARSREQVISGSQPIQGKLVYIARNPKGKDFDYTMPKVSLSPNGDYALKSDEWQQIPLSIEILKPDNQEAIYVDGRPFTAV